MKLDQPIRHRTILWTVHPIPKGVYKVVVSDCKGFGPVRNNKYDDLYEYGMFIDFKILGEVDWTTKELVTSGHEGRIVTEKLLHAAKSRDGKYTTIETINKQAKIGSEKTSRYIYAAGLNEIKNVRELIGRELAVEIVSPEDENFPGRFYSNVRRCFRLTNNG